jgi:hypothetical protein
MSSAFGFLFIAHRVGIAPLFHLHNIDEGYHNQQALALKNKKPS